MPPVQEIKKSARGFASINPEKRWEIARKGGKSVPDNKRAFSLNPELASKAGRKGGRKVAPRKRSFSRDHALAAEAGRKGGHAVHGAAALFADQRRDQERGL